MDIYYLNNNGEKLDFLSDTIAIQNIEDLFEDKWEYEASNSMNFGGKVKKFYKGVQTRDLTLGIAVESESEFAKVCKEISDIFNYDVRLGKPGRIYINGLYLDCYITTSKYADFEDLMYMTNKEFEVLATYPSWISEKEVEITNGLNEDNAVVGLAVCGLAVVGTALSDDSGDSEESTSYITNESDFPCQFRMKITGPASNPYVSIGDNVYELLELELLEGESIVIDSIKRTCIMTDADGNESSVFGYRNSEYSLFEKIPSGTSQVKWSVTAGLSFVLIEERGEPLWN